jgi:hypothetical protein
LNCPRTTGARVSFTALTFRLETLTLSLTALSGAPIPMTSSTIVYTVEEFNDFTNTSRLYDDTDISEELKEMVEFMSYRGALTWDNILRTSLIR